MTLHLPPPEILTFCRTLEDFSKMAILVSGEACSAALMAEKKPAAPPPMIRMSHE